MTCTCKPPRPMQEVRDLVRAYGRGDDLLPSWRALVGTYGPDEAAALLWAFLNAEHRMDAAQVRRDKIFAEIRQEQRAEQEGQEK